MTKAQKVETSAEEKSPRRRKRNQRFAMPLKPALPVNALWEMATPEQRVKAHETSVVIMEYWLGRITKKEVGEKLKMPPLRIWQLSQQAISGMVAGLLIQPKTRAPRGSKNKWIDVTHKSPENDPQELRKMIVKLERTVAMQDRLISVLREMPGCKDAKIPMEDPQEGMTPEGMPQDAAATRAAKKATGQVPAGARHEAQSNSNGTGSPDHAKRVRESR